MINPDCYHDQEVTFTSGGDLISGSFLLPASGGSPWPAAVILSGSGPTDRNGNNALAPRPFNTNRNFAGVLAMIEVASLRYDKLGSGTTSHVRRMNPSQLDFSVFVDEAQAAYMYLHNRPEIDPRRIFFLGHSEGALIALVVTTQFPEDQKPPLLVLAAPPGFRYLDIVRRQFSEQSAAAVAAGEMPGPEAETALAELDRLIAELRLGAMLPPLITNVPLRMLFSPAAIRFLTEVDAFDPRELAGSLGNRPVLLLRGQKDQQVTAADVARIEAGMLNAGNTHWRSCQPANADHLFKDVVGVPNPADDYGNPDLPFSSEAVACLTAFLHGYLLKT